MAANPFPPRLQAEICCFRRRGTGKPFCPSGRGKNPAWLLSNDPYHVGDRKEILILDQP